MAGLTSRVTVVVGDDHPVYRHGVVRALKETGTIEVVAEAADGRTVMDAIREHHPDVAVVDYKMPGLTGFEMVHAVDRDGLGARVIVLSAFDDAALVYQALAAGASGYLTKESDREEIAEAVSRCARGEKYVPAQLASGLASEVHQRARGDTALLSPRESEVVRLISEGLSVPQMARRLHLAPTTVRTHVQNSLRKTRRL